LGKSPQKAIKVKITESSNWLTTVLALFLSQRNCTPGSRVFHKLYAHTSCNWDTA